MYKVLHTYKDVPDELKEFTSVHRDYGVIQDWLGLSYLLNTLEKKKKPVVNLLATSAEMPEKIVYTIVYKDQI